MPKTGTPASNRAGSTCGAPGSYTLDGPPDRMIAAGSAGQHLGDRHRVRHDLGVDVGLAHAAGDQLGVLGAEVDDENRARSSHGLTLSAGSDSSSRVRTRPTGDMRNHSGRQQEQGHQHAMATRGDVAVASPPAGQRADRQRAAGEQPQRRRGAAEQFARAPTTAAPPARTR